MHRAPRTIGNSRQFFRNRWTPRQIPDERAATEDFSQDRLDDQLQAFAALIFIDR